MDPEILKAVKRGEVMAIVPARAGSKGVKNKNIRCINGYPLIAWSIAAGNMSSLIDRVIVSTDSGEYADIARRYGAEVPFMRPAELAGDNSTDIEFMEHAIGKLYEDEGSVPEYFVHLRPTYPMRDIDVVDGAVRKMLSDPAASSLRSAHPADVSPFKWFQRDEEGYFRPMYDTMTLDDANRPRQSFPPVFIPDGYVDVLRTESIIKNDVIHGDLMIGYVVDDGVDVDTMKDMARLEEISKTARPAILKYLQDNYEPMTV